MEANHSKRVKTKPQFNADMAILENPMDWLREFQQGWLDHFERTGEMDWKRYVRPRNILAPSGKGVVLAESRVMLVSTAGGYLHGSQERFDDENPLGDYSIRRIPMGADFDEIQFAHTHYSHEYVDADPQVLVPLRHLEAMVDEGRIGSLTTEMVSYSGYHPNVLRVVKETIPAVLKAAREMEAQAALLVPV